MYWESFLIVWLTSFSQWILQSSHYILSYRDTVHAYLLPGWVVTSQNTNISQSFIHINSSMYNGPCVSFHHQTSWWKDIHLKYSAYFRDLFKGWLHQAAPNTQRYIVQTGFMIAMNSTNARSSCLDGSLIEKKKILAHSEFVGQKSLISPREISNEKKIASLLL